MGDIVRKPEDLVAWQLCMELGTYIAEIIADGPVSHDFGFCKQIRKSSSAPAPHIAEGFGRWGPKEFAHYLRMAVSSLMETQTHLEYGRERKYFTPAVHSGAVTLCGRALYVTKQLLKSKLRQIAQQEEERRKRNKRPPLPPRRRSNGGRKS
jgi:four helix bundle protein